MRQLGRVDGRMAPVILEQCTWNVPGYRKHLGSAGGPLLMSESGLGHQSWPRRRHPENKGHLFRHMWESFVEYVLICWGMFSSIVFRRAPGFNVHGFERYCLHPCLTCVYTCQHLWFQRRVATLMFQKSFLLVQKQPFQQIW